jgi:TP53 regulating kinase-like protein
MALTMLPPDAEPPKSGSKKPLKIPLHVEDSKLLCQCAESSVYLRPNLSELGIDVPVILKLRHPKRYRIPEIEDSLSRARIKQEVSNMKKAVKLKLPVPEVYFIDYEEKAIFMQYLDTFCTLKTFLKGVSEIPDSEEQAKRIMAGSGEICAALHAAGVNHGDLTSSNFMVDKNSEVVYLIDFGLSFNSGNVEDKAVDLYVFEKSLLCEENSERMLTMLVDAFFDGYRKKSGAYDAVFGRLQKVKARGRKKVMIG